MLKDSTNLLSLSFKYCNNITDISVISNFSELSTLDMYCCEGITDISPLSNLTELYDLNIAYCKGITDISPLKNLKYIHKLYLGYLYFTDKNEASYMETISSLTNIDTLSINYCNLGNEHTSMFKNLTNLRYLNLHNNNITDFSFLKDFVNLEYKGDNYSTVDLTLFDNITDYSIPNDIIDDDGNYVKPVESELYDYNETTNEIILNIDKFSETGNNYVVYEFVLEVNDSYKTTIKHEKKINITKFSPTLSIFNYYTSSMNTTKGDFIQLNVNVTHGKISDYKYKFAVLNKSNNTWYVLRDFDSNPTLDYNLNYTGTKIFAVTVMDSRNNTIATNRVEVNVYDPLKSSLTINNSTNKIVCQMGSKITLKGNGKGGSGDYTYSFLEYNVETEKWTILTDFITSSAYTHTLDCAGEKKFAVNIKDSTKKLVTSNLIPVTVYKPLKGNLKVNGSKNAIVATKGDKINLVATGYYGSEVYTYKFAVLNEETGKWSLLRDFSSNNTLEYSLNYTGKKQFAVTIMDTYGNTVATNRLSVTVTE